MMRDYYFKMRTFLIENRYIKLRLKISNCSMKLIGLSFQFCRLPQNSRRLIESDNTGTRNQIRD